MRRASRTLKFEQCLSLKSSDTFEKAEHSLFNSPIVIRSHGFHFRSTDLADNPYSYDSGSICKQTWIKNLV